MGLRIIVLALVFVTVTAGNAAPASPNAETTWGPPVPGTSEVTYGIPANYDTLVQWWKDLEAQYPNFVYGWSPNQAYGFGQIPSSTAHPPYDLWYVRITNESRGLLKPEVFFMGNPHGDERTGPIGAYWFADWWLRNARTDAYNTPYDDWLNWLLDHREVYFAVSHNPDGFDRLRRCDATNIDPNREADHDGPEPAQSGCTRTPSTVFDTVAGKVVARFLNEHQIRTGMDFHGGTRALLYPWGSTRAGVQGVSPVTGRTWSYAPPDFAFFDVFGHRMGDYIGDFGGDYGVANVGTPPGIVGYVARGTYLSWAYGADTANNPAESPYVDNDGAYPGAGALWFTPEISFTKNPASGYGGDDTLGWGIDVRRMLLAMIDIAQPYVRWHPSGIPDGARVEVGDPLTIAWQVNGSLVVDATRIQWGADPDPVNSPTWVLPERTDFAGQWSGGTGWDGAQDGQASGTVWTEQITAPMMPGTYYVVARAKVDQRYRDVLRPDVYGAETYLRVIKERTWTGWSESLPGADGIERMESQEYWYSEVLRIEVGPDATPPVITLRSPPDGSVIRSGTRLDFHVADNTLATATVSVDGQAPAPFAAPWDVSTTGWTETTHWVRIVATDRGGLTTTADFSFVVDDTPPTINPPTLGPDPIFRRGTLLDFEVQDPHFRYAAWTTGGPSDPLPPPFDVDTSAMREGPANLTIYAEDAAGNWATRTYALLVDAGPPVLTLLSPPEGSVIAPGTVLDLAATDASPQFTVAWTVGGPPQALPPPFDIDTTGWPDGPVTVETIAADVVGFTSWANFTFEVDGTAPAIALVSPADGALLEPGTDLDFDVTDPHLASVSYATSLGSSGPLPPPYDLSTAGWIDGTVTVEVRARDAIGNEVARTFTVRIDGAAPVVARTDAGDLFRAGHVLTFAVTDAWLDAVTWNNGGGEQPLATPYEVPTAGWGDGDYTVTITATDLLGHTTVLSVPITIDSVPPGIDASHADAVVRPGTTIAFTASDPHLLGFTDLLVTGREPMEISPPVATLEVGTAGWADGAYEIEVRARDEAGNTAAFATRITVDGTPPAISNLGAENPALNRPLRIRATVADPNGVAAVRLHWRLAGGSWTDVAMSGAQGTYAADLAPLSEPATVEFYVTAEDGVGNAARSEIARAEVAAPPPPLDGGSPLASNPFLWTAILAVLIPVAFVLRRRRSSRADRPLPPDREPLREEREEHQDDHEGDRE